MNPLSRLPASRFREVKFQRRSEIPTVTLVVCNEGRMDLMDLQIYFSCSACRRSEGGEGGGGVVQLVLPFQPSLI